MSTMKRELTICSKYYSSGPETKYASDLRLVGLWLNQCGFNPGDRVSVELIEGKLVIQRLSSWIERHPEKPAKKYKK